MKTAISIPDRVFEEAEQVAKRLGISRSQLYSKAVQAYIAANRTEGVTQALNRVYSKVTSGMDLVLACMQSPSLPREKW
jgi:metal-responsive CopG/Arc/MetJ family transcriptional regulator